jgi:hypothetical protein
MDKGGSVGVILHEGNYNSNGEPRMKCMRVFLGFPVWRSKVSS